MLVGQGSVASRKIAVIGGGISGMAAAHLLAGQNEVTVFEAATRLGGHARTVLAGKRGDQPVDTGFIVFNYENYPHLTALFDQLNVPVAKSNMTFGASIDGGRIEYGLRNLASVFAQPANLFRPRFLAMMRDVVRFNSRALELSKMPGLTIRDLLEHLGTGDWFRDYYLLPLSGAIWSVPPQQILEFPAEAMIRFFANHALLHHSGQHQWWTVDGGSIQYVRRLEASLRAQGVVLRLGANVQAVRRGADGAQVRSQGTEWQSFDEVIFATHADVTLALLADATPTEKANLGAVRFQPNQAVLHADTSIMPKRRAVWSSWVYTEAADKASDQIDLTYWMNSLQPIPKGDPLFVTLNGARPIKEELIYDQVTFQHPVYDQAAMAAQSALRADNGTNRTWFCGAWMRNGFHEDGFASAVDVVSAMTAGPAFQMAAE